MSNTTNTTNSNSNSQSTSPTTLQAPEIKEVTGGDEITALATQREIIEEDPIQICSEEPRDECETPPPRTPRRSTGGKAPRKQLSRVPVKPVEKDPESSESGEEVDNLSRSSKTTRSDDEQDEIPKKKAKMDEIVAENTQEVKSPEKEAQIADFEFKVPISKEENFATLFRTLCNVGDHQEPPLFCRSCFGISTMGDLVQCCHGLNCYHLLHVDCIKKMGLIDCKQCVEEGHESKALAQCCGAHRCSGYRCMSYLYSEVAPSLKCCSTCSAAYCRSCVTGTGGLLQVHNLQLCPTCLDFRRKIK